MKTISMQTGRIMSFEHSQTLAGTASDLARFSGGHARLAEWLPTPAPRRLAETKTILLKKAQGADSLWIPLGGDQLAEKLMIALLIIASLAAIGYGFSSMLDLVQDWAGFNRLVGQLIQ
ncbi:MAG: hypothetical protein QOJ40_965 [Verrucomicrobiota bacterium]